jgi:hypothetical protein
VGTGVKDAVLVGVLVSVGVFVAVPVATGTVCVWLGVTEGIGVKDAVFVGVLVLVGVLVAVKVRGVATQPFSAALTDITISSMVTSPLPSSSARLQVLASACPRAMFTVVMISSTVTEPCPSQSPTQAPEAGVVGVQVGDDVAV